MAEHGDPARLPDPVKGPFACRHLKTGRFIVTFRNVFRIFRNFRTVFCFIIVRQIIDAVLTAEMDNVNGVVRQMHFFPGADQHIAAVVRHCLLCGQRGGILAVIGKRHKVEPVFPAGGSHIFRRFLAVGAVAVHVEIAFVRHEFVKIFFQGINAKDLFLRKGAVFLLRFQIDDIFTFIRYGHFEDQIAIFLPDEIGGGRIIDPGTPPRYGTVHTEKFDPSRVVKPGLCVTVIFLCRDADFLFLFAGAEDRGGNCKKGTVLIFHEKVP